MSRSAGSLLQKFSLPAGLGAEVCLLPDTKHERVLWTEVRLCCACLFIVTCASYGSTLSGHIARTPSSQLFGNGFDKRLVPCLNLWLFTVVRAAGPVGVVAYYSTGLAKVEEGEHQGEKTNLDHPQEANLGWIMKDREETKSKHLNRRLEEACLYYVLRIT